MVAEREPPVPSPRTTDRCRPARSDVAGIEPEPVADDLLENGLMALPWLLEPANIVAARCDQIVSRHLQCQGLRRARLCSRRQNRAIFRTFLLPPRL